MTVSEKAYAKINLYLDVTARREDGFHDIESLMHSVDLCDIVIISSSESERTEISITTNDPELPTDSGNIVYRAITNYLSFFDRTARVEVNIEKKIPVGAGLGGGSSDAAAALRAMNRIYGLASRDQLYEIASGLGSDVPFCLRGGICLCHGRGEQITSVSSSECMTFVIAIGERRVSTPKAYAALDEKYSFFKEKKEIISSTDIADFPRFNIFEQVIDFDEIDKIKENMIKNGAEYTLMSGSGPSVFGEFKKQAHAEEACDLLLKSGFSAFVCHSVYPEVNI